MERTKGVYDDFYTSSVLYTMTVLKRSSCLLVNFTKLYRTIFIELLQTTVSVFKSSEF